MHKNYIILVHNNPDQLVRLVNKLNDKYSSFFIHVDKTSDISVFISKFSTYSNVKFITKREIGTWGGIGIVKATLNAIGEILENSENDGHLILLSGQDYPLKNNEYINHFFSKYKKFDFIDISPIKEVFPKEWKKRVLFYKYDFSNKKGNYILVPPLFSKEILDLNSIKIIVKIFLNLKNFTFYKAFFKNLTKKRAIPKNLTLMAGGQWWSISTVTAKKIYAFSKQNNELLDYFKYSILPDEVYFQTVINHLKRSDVSIKTKSMVTYVNWERKDCTLPVTFVSSDFEELTSQDETKLFARKFDLKLDNEIFNLIDKLHNNN